MKSKITINDIANEIGISTSTVSRALKNSSSISSAVKDKVRETAKRLGYSNVTILNQPKTIVFIVPELNNYFYSEVLAAFQKRIHAEDYVISIYCSYNSAEKEKQIVANLETSQVCCLIISQSMDATDSEHLHILEEKNIPVIMFNRVDYGYHCPRFLIDNYMDAYMATNHLLSAGYRKIAMAAKHYHCNIYKERIQAYKDALCKNGIAFNPDYLVYSELTPEDTHDVVTRFVKMKNAPDAILLPNYLAALQACSIARISNIRIPEELGLFSFDEEPYSKLSNPSISGIERPLKEMGIAMARLVQKIIEKERYNKEETRIFSSNLIIRGSSLTRKTQG
jgi:Transcriptional regulators